MRQILIALILLAGVTALPSAPARAEVSADVNLHFGQTYPVVFSRAPRVYVVPNTNVYYSANPEYDMFRYGDRWYINDGGVWFSAVTYRGPFVRVAFESVPRGVLQVPGRYRHQSRGYWENHWWQSNNWRDKDSRNNGRGHGRGYERDPND